MAGPDDDATYLADNQELEENRIDHPQPRIERQVCLGKTSPGVCFVRICQRRHLSFVCQGEGDGLTNLFYGNR